MIDTPVGLHIGLTILGLALIWRLARGPRVRHPPSPLSLPLVGNLFSIPSGHEHAVFAKLGEQLQSDMVYLNVLGHKVIILNSAEDATELLEKRAALYSDRTQIPMVVDPALMDWSQLITIVGYNDLWRHYRRIMNDWLSARAVAQFHTIQEHEARLLLRRLLNTTNHTEPFRYVKDAFFFTMASIMFQLAYGYKPKDSQDPFVEQAAMVVRNIASAAMQTNYLVNVFPAMVYIPDWFPGAGWKRTGREYGVRQHKAKTEPYNWLKAQVTSGTHQPSLLSPLLQDHKLLSGLNAIQRDERLKEVGFVVYAAGTDSSAHFFVALVSALVMNPNIQAKAQEELDTVLGQAVLPSILDRERLPYIRNLIDEVLRLYPIFPLAVPHVCFQEDTYRGYNIEKGTTIIGNVWAIGRDPRYYRSPEVFDPDRYLDSDVPRPPVFGWGRRKCPGVHFAEASAFITTASLLAMFSFSKKKDSNGQEIVPQVELERNSFLFELKPFDFELKPRSDVHHQLILEIIDD
ncbi:O-methylsterigmatocystin oxidoreductase OS=Aspergillus flavus (strain ATCC 200026 / FGSC A1120 / NRRL 3357 / JCM 12722 / SRRC 167) GN=ordA PE=2 SV=1 [Rhizoctonia solani AG-1 IB]|uniref:O-methylsterigmatocystin oxidoreductase n=1 Tax=Thanatephorus cucumeris (strain AG1-IB / isolate 7/3/14) TaxID=1108050 RepID=A0A0B7FSG8_THACB|nr:O-methylsterigmatocystin oxidoreductase OS=Aspergillus flavus (strain ATCC 200026 / FGSC A1120 / NRRL 3357 / JCM 12722 / SRRC 167) GN=ordA PE=2 SV=1 [Rhizoctonia solani AG-1 IB]